MLAREVHHLGDLGLGNFICKRPTNAHATLVDMQHDLGRLLAIFGEKPLQHMNHKLHRRIVVIEHDDLVHRGLLSLLLGLYDNAGIAAVAAADLMVVIVQSCLNTDHAWPFTQNSSGHSM